MPPPQTPPGRPQVGHLHPHPSTFSSRPRPPPPQSSRTSPARTTDRPPSSNPGFLFSACTHYHALAPLDIESIIYPSSIQTTYPCLCSACDFTLHLQQGASIRQLWFDIAVPRYNFLIELGESTVRPHGGRQENGWTPRENRAWRWVGPVLEEARRIREEQGRRVVEFVRESIEEFGTRWGREEGERLREGLRGIGGG
jgi:hypothetical protein